MTGTRAAAGVRLIQVGSALFLVTGLLAIPGEAGDCGGTAATCDAFRVAGMTRTRILVGIIVAMAFLAVVAWRSRRRIFPALLLAAAAVVLVLGLASFVVRLPDWVPILIGYTFPASAILVAGAFVRFRSLVGG